MSVIPTNKLLLQELNQFRTESKKTKVGKSGWNSEETSRKYRRQALLHKHKVFTLNLFPKSFRALSDALQIETSISFHPSDVTRLDGARARSEFGAPMFEAEVFRKQMYCIEESICDYSGDFSAAPAVIRRPGNCSPLSPSRYAPVPSIEFWPSSPEPRSQKFRSRPHLNFLTKFRPRSLKVLTRVSKQLFCHISYCTTDRRPDIFCNVIVSG